MNLVKAQELAKELSIPDLQKYANGSNPEIMPPYIALGALQAKESMQKKMQAMQGAAQGEQPSVKEQVEQKAGLMALQGQQQQQAQQQMMQQAQARPMPAPEGVPQPESQPQAESTMMAAGGITRLPVNFNFKDGGIIGYAGPEGSTVDAFGVELDNARAAKQQALAELRKFGLQQKMKDPQGYIQAETAFRDAAAREAQAQQAYSGKLEGTSATRAATNVRDIGQAYRDVGFDEPELAIEPQAAPQKPPLSPVDMAMRQAPGGLPNAMPKPPTVAPPITAPVARPPAQMAAPAAAAQPAAPVDQQAQLIKEEAERRKAFGIDQEIGAGAESRMAEKRRRFEEGKPSGLDDLIRVFGQAGQYKGLSGMGPAYTANQERKRAEQEAFESQMEQQQTGIEEKRRAERVARAGGIGEGLGKLRELQQKTDEAKARNLTSLEVARIQAASANRPGEVERMMSVYSDLKARDPAAAEEYMKNIGRIRSGAAAAKSVMTRNEAIDNVNKLLVDPGNRMEMKKEAAAALGKKDPSFSEVLEYHVQKNMGTTPTSATATGGATRIKFDAQGNPIK